MYISEPLISNKYRLFSLHHPSPRVVSPVVSPLFFRPAASRVFPDSQGTRRQQHIETWQIWWHLPQNPTVSRISLQGKKTETFGNTQNDLLSKSMLLMFQAIKIQFFGVCCHLNGEWKGRFSEQMVDLSTRKGHQTQHGNGIFSLHALIILQRPL